MTGQSFSLIPFGAANLPAIRIFGTVALQNHDLAIHYFLSGRVEDITLPPLSRHSGRRDDLWKSTCFEFFLALKDGPGYWEFNISPSGHWNVYQMDAYRRIGFRQESAIENLPFTFKREVEGYSLDAAVDLDPIIPPGQAVEMGITAIVQTKDGSETYWALTHPGPEPDFHLRDGFILALAGQTRLSGSPARDD